MKEKIKGLSSIRTIATLGIIIYHASLILCSDVQEAPTEFFNKMSMSGWGNILVTVFFVLSGFCIVCNNNPIGNIGKFYKKRVLSIFISFYMVWFFVYFKNVILFKNIFYAGKPLSIILSLLGSDGYWGGSYYSIGEWFLGALLICYFIYPLLLLGYRKNIWLSSGILLILYVLGLKFQFGYWDISFRGIFTCVLSFWIGMLLYKYKDSLLHNYLILVCALDIFWHLYTWKVSGIDVTTWSVLTGVVCFILLYFMGDKIQNAKNLQKVMDFLSSISFQMFLLHHLIINKCGMWLRQKEIAVTGLKKWLVFIGILIIIIIFSIVLKKINDLIIKLFTKKSKKQNSQEYKR